MTYYMSLSDRREAGGGACDVYSQLSFIIDGLQFQVRGSLVPSPTPSFSLLAVLQATYGKQRKAERGTVMNKATLYLRGVPQVAERISPSS